MPVMVNVNHEKHPKSSQNDAKCVYSDVLYITCSRVPLMPLTRALVVVNAPRNFRALGLLLSHPERIMQGDDPAKINHVSCQPINHPSGQWNLPLHLVQVVLERRSNAQHIRIYEDT